MRDRRAAGVHVTLPGDRLRERPWPTRGYPTSYAAPAMRERFGEIEGLPPVWPDAEGPTRGLAFSPLYPNVVKAALEDEDLYAALAAIDLVRGEGAREHAVGQDVLARMIGRDRPE